MNRFADVAIRSALGAIAGVLRKLPRNNFAWSYTIDGYDATPYVDRTLLPRLAGHRVLIHRIHREDSDRWMHNHPWRTAAFLIVSGGYTEERRARGGYYGKEGMAYRRVLRPGQVNHLDAGDFHRVISVLPNTWTVGVVGDRCQDWGFIVGDEGFVPHADYFARRNYTSAGPGTAT